MPAVQDSKPAGGEGVAAGIVFAIGPEVSCLGGLDGGAADLRAGAVGSELQEFGEEQRVDERLAGDEAGVAKVVVVFDGTGEPDASDGGERHVDSGEVRGAAKGGDVAGIGADVAEGVLVEGEGEAGSGSEGCDPDKVFLAEAEGTGQDHGLVVCYLGGATSGSGEGTLLDRWEHRRRCGP